MNYSTQKKQTNHLLTCLPYERICYNISLNATKDNKPYELIYDHINLRSPDKLFTQNELSSKYREMTKFLIITDHPESTQCPKNANEENDLIKSITERGKMSIKLFLFLLKKLKLRTN